MYNQYSIGYWIMRIAVYTKSSLTGHPVRSKLLAELSCESGLLLTEIPQGSEIPAGFDRLLAFGGDGTMLEAAVRAARADVPLVGVNIGNLGFLTQFDAKVDAKTLAAALKCESVTRRMLIECTADGKSYLALNDIVVKSASARPVSIELRVNGQFSDAYRSDGVIVATPTGSTAYSLSAGGPVLAPDLSALVVNPVCPHTLHSRPLVVGADAMIELDIIGGEGAGVIVDGAASGTLSSRASVKVKRSSLTAPFVNAGGEDFYARLLDKMNRWGSAQSAEVTV